MIEKLYFLNNYLSIHIVIISMISFDNFPDTTNPHVKLTPRSHEALKRTGIKLDDLIVRNADDINTKYGDNITDKALIEKRVIHYEEKRKGKLDLLKKVRIEVLDDESKGVWNSQNVTNNLCRKLKQWLWEIPRYRVNLEAT